MLKAIVGLETYEQGEIVINGEKITRPDYGDMLKRGIGYTPENRKEAGIIPRLGVDENTVLTNRQKNQRQRCAAMVHHPPPDRRGDAADDGQGRQ